MKKWYKKEWLKFDKTIINNKISVYHCYPFTIYKVQTYYFAFYKSGLLLNRNEFCQRAAYGACLIHDYSLGNAKGVKANEVLTQYL